MSIPKVFEPPILKEDEHPTMFLRLINDELYQWWRFSHDSTRGEWRPVPALEVG
jgi:hypothetical protein